MLAKVLKRYHTNQVVILVNINDFNKKAWFEKKGTF